MQVEWIELMHVTSTSTRLKTLKVGIDDQPELHQSHSHITRWVQSVGQALYAPISPERLLLVQNRLGFAWVSTVWQIQPYRVTLSDTGRCQDRHPVRH